MLQKEGAQLKRKSCFYVYMYVEGSRCCLVIVNEIERIGPDVWVKLHFHVLPTVSLMMRSNYRGVRLTVSQLACSESCEGQPPVLKN